MHIYIYAFIYIYIYIYMHLYIYIYTCVCVSLSLSLYRLHTCTIRVCVYCRADGTVHPNGGFQVSMATPKWLIYEGKPMKMDELGASISGNQQMQEPFSFWERIAGLINYNDPFNCQTWSNVSQCIPRIHIKLLMITCNVYKIHFLYNVYW